MHVIVLRALKRKVDLNGSMNSQNTVFIYTSWIDGIKKKTLAAIFCEASPVGDADD